MHATVATLSNSQGKNASLIIHSTDSIMVYPLVTAQDKQKSTMQSVKEKKRSKPATPSLYQTAPDVKTTPD